jgi:putative membrane protein
MANEAGTNPAAAPDQVQLAVDRTFLAYERTLMAWIRTATSLITFGFTLYKFFEYVQGSEHARLVDQLLGPRMYGLIMIALGVLTLAVATWQHRHNLKRLGAHYPELPVSLSALLAVLIAGLGILAFTAALLRE